LLRFDAAWFLLPTGLVGRIGVSAKVIAKPVLLWIAVDITDQMDEMVI